MYIIRPLTMILLLSSSAVSAGTLKDVLQDPLFNHLELAPLAPVLAATVASTYPVASASASVVYEYNPAMETFERRTGVAGPIIGERAETIGSGRFDVTASYSYVGLHQMNGDDLHSLQNRKRVNGRVIVFPVPDGVILKDGRFTNYLPVSVVADIDVDAHILAPSVTYGITADLDVNVTLPFLHTSLDVTADTLVPDPRFPSFALPPGDPHAQSGSRSASDAATGVGDVLLRAKYVLLRARLVDVAAGLGLSLPTGDEDDFQGTGATHVQPAIILSHVIAEHYEPLLNVGIDLNAEDVGRSVVRWVVGGTAELGRGFTGALVFLGRHELEAQADPLAYPFFFQIERNDIFDASVGLRYQFAENGFVAANAIVPLNEEGLSAPAIPTVAFEYTF